MYSIYIYIYILYLYILYYKSIYTYIYIYIYVYIMLYMICRYCVYMLCTYSQVLRVNPLTLSQPKWSSRVHGTQMRRVNPKIQRVNPVAFCSRASEIPEHNSFRPNPWISFRVTAKHIFKSILSKSLNVWSCHNTEMCPKYVSPNRHSRFMIRCAGRIHITNWGRGSKAYENHTSICNMYSDQFSERE